MTARPWVRSRFHAAPDDWRAITWPPPGPCWRTGYGDGYSVVVAYHREDGWVVAHGLPGWGGPVVRSGDPAWQ